MMQKTVYIVHGWGGNPEEGWFPWLRDKLHSKDINVNVPAMPNPDEPTLSEWAGFLKDLVKHPDEDTYFVGHSMGCRAILEYLATPNLKVGGAILVAGWVTLEGKNLASDEERKLAQEWQETEPDYEEVKHSCDKFVGIFSDNDPYVPFKENSEVYSHLLGAKILLESGKGHFSGEDGIDELPVVWEELQRMMNLTF